MQNCFRIDAPKPLRPTQAPEATFALVVLRSQWIRPELEQQRIYLDAGTVRAGLVRERAFGAFMSSLGRWTQFYFGIGSRGAGCAEANSTILSDAPARLIVTDGAVYDAS
jgi:hypothetical protein